MDFAVWLHRERTRAGWSLLKLAGIAGVSHASIQRLESGDRLPSREMAVKLAHAIGSPIEDALIAAGFLPENALGVATTPDEAALLIAYRRGDETVRRMFSSMAREVAATG